MAICHITLKRERTSVGLKKHPTLKTETRSVPSYFENSRAKVMLTSLFCLRYLRH